MTEIPQQELRPVIRFGDYEVNRERGILLRAGLPLKLQPQPFRALVLLIERAPQIVSREELAANIWGDGVHVELEQGLNYCIRQIRQVLDDRPVHPKFVETLPRQGYRFIGAIIREATIASPMVEVPDAHTTDIISPGETPPEQVKSADVPVGAHSLPHSTILSRRGFLWTFGVAAAAGGGVWSSNAVRRKPRTGAIHVAIPIPQGAGVADPGRLLGPPVVAPDGSAVVVSLRTSTGNQLYIRPLKANELIPMAETQDASEPFWSPDSQHIGFFAEGKLKRVPSIGGSVAVLCDAQKPRGGSWGSRGSILFGLNTLALFEVAESGGPVSEATRLDRAGGENSHRNPVFLPDGNQFLYLARNDNPDRRGVYLESMDHSVPRKKVLVADGGFALGLDPDTGDSFILSEQVGRIVAQRFETRRGELVGQVHHVTDRSGMISASNTGVLVMRTEQLASGLVWRDRSGANIGKLGEKADFWAIALSPNGQLAAAVKHDSPSGQFTAWVASLQRGAFELLSDATHASSIMWSSDSSALYYADIREWKMFRRRLHPRGLEELVCYLPGETGIAGISPDGRYAAGELGMMSAHTEAVWAELSSSSNGALKPDAWHPLGPSDAHGPVPRFSPDGNWLAFSSNRSGTAEIYVMDFPWGLQRYRVSTGGGRSPRWRGDGRELFYLSEGGDIMAVSISSQRELQIGKPHGLFAANLRAAGEGALYDVSSDGQRFLLIDGGDGSANSNIEMILNWPSLLA